MRLVTEVFFFFIFIVGCASTSTIVPISPSEPAASPMLSAVSTPVPSAAPAHLSKSFDGQHAYQEYVIAQMKIGIRPAGSPGDRATGDYILAQLEKSGWQVETQEFHFQNIPIRNLVGKQSIGKGPLIIVGAHYDSRPRADRDPQNPYAPMPAANDGASGVAVLLELARTLDVSRLHHEVWLAFLDAEDNGELTTCDLVNAGKSPTPSAPCDRTIWPFSVGATYLAEHLNTKPDAVVILDMIGDADQNIYYEQNSDPEIQQQLWTIAAKLGYARQFIPQYKYSLDDDHTPFLQRQMRAVDVIDFDYPYWHTTQDTADKVSAGSLARVGQVIKTWLEGR